MTKKVKDEIKRQKSRWRRLAPVAAAFWHLAMFTLVVGGSLFGIYALWSLALEDPRFRMDGETLSLAGAIRECPESVAELEAIGKSFNNRSLLDPGIIGDLERAYGNSVWIKRITKMRRKFPNRMEVQFTLRLPAAQVWHDSRYWMVDSEATLLPVDGSRQAFPRLPKIVGVTSNVLQRRPVVGEMWNDEGVTGALGIMRSFWGSPLAEAVPIERVVVNAGSLQVNSSVPVEARRRFEVVASSGAVVRWGTFNPGDLAGELTSSEKLWQLQDLLCRDEALRPGVCFDVRTRLPGYVLQPDS